MNLSKNVKLTKEEKLVETKLKERQETQKSLKEMLEINGITLIALVVTIIILLILAGVSIATLTGDNGILGQARKCKRKN